MTDFGFQDQTTLNGNHLKCHGIRGKAVQVLRKEMFVDEFIGMLADGKLTAREVESILERHTR